MKDLCVPVPNINDEEFAEIQVKVGDKKQNYNYRVVSFPWESGIDETGKEDDLELSLLRIQGLKSALKNYDKSWELIQIFTPAENASHIQVLYRKK